jgi:hypothetical protein
MRLHFYTVAIPILACVSWAQDTPPSQPQQPAQPTRNGAPSTTEDSSSGNQADRTAGQQSDRTTGQQTSRDSVSQSDTMNGKASSNSQEAKTMTYSGTLMDASCAGPGAGSPNSTASNASSSSSSANSAAGSMPTSGSSTNSADRSSTAGMNAGTSAGACAVSSNTTTFALKTKEGTTYRFDEVGNSRVQEAMQKKKKWRDSATANKEIKVKAKGMVSGDKLIVMSVD